MLKIASATKLITSIALLQCVEKGLIGLDEPLTRILPEFERQEILRDVIGTEFKLEKSNTQITARHLLSHTSGLTYDFLHPLLSRRAEIIQEKKASGHVTDKYNYPLIFEPGTGWSYGCGLDWAGLVVSRLNGGMTLEDYLVENIWKKLGVSAPFPRFNIASHPDYDALKMQLALLTDDETLEHMEQWDIIDDPEAQNGGEGLSATVDNYLAVLTDLISDTPKLLSPETISNMFTPQLPSGSAVISGLLALRPMWETVTGPIADDGINHGLGGILCLASVDEVNQPANMLAWGGATNVLWWANRELGVAGFFGTQQAPTANPTVTKLINAWKRDFWASYNVFQ